MKVGSSVLLCVAGNTVPLNGINSLGMFWLSLSTSQCPAYTYVQARTQLYIKDYCWIQGNGNLRLYFTSTYYNNAHNFVFETELHQSKDFDEGSDLDKVF